MAASKRWSLEDIAWDRFDRSCIDPSMIRIVKAASLVEHNAGDYVHYLKEVFAGDASFAEAIELWGQEEVQHGQALARWARCADPEFDFDQVFARFREGYSIDVNATESIRGSRSAELVARCIVEVGTSSYYSALKNATDEPVLQAICGWIASDEVRHFRMFRDHLERYLQVEPVSRLRRLQVALGRMDEVTDDELAFAYHCANYDEDVPYDQRRAAALYLTRAFDNYNRNHVRKIVSMTARAVGVKLPNWTQEGLAEIGFAFMRRRARTLTEAANKNVQSSVKHPAAKSKDRAAA